MTLLRTIMAIGVEPQATFAARLLAGEPLPWSKTFGDCGSSRYASTIARLVDAVANGNFSEDEACLMARDAAEPFFCGCLTCGAAPGVTCHPKCEARR